MKHNIDHQVVQDFGDEWDAYRQTQILGTEAERLFQAYFSVFPWDKLPKEAVGMDVGCGSGRWAYYASQKVGTLHCVDPAEKALAVAQSNLEDRKNCRFHKADALTLPMKNESLDFGYSLGVLHHIPDTALALQACVRKLKKGAPFLLYLYYRFDNRPFWFVQLWRLSEIGRRKISKLPFRQKLWVTKLIAALIYYPLARLSFLLEKIGFNVSSMPLSTYRHTSFYTMKTDALDRFGTTLEQRFTKKEMQAMMARAGLKDVVFSALEPYWCAVGVKA